MKDELKKELLNKREAEHEDMENFQRIHLAKNEKGYS